MCEKSSSSLVIKEYSLTSKDAIFCLWVNLGFVFDGDSFSGNARNKTLSHMTGRSVNWMKLSGGQWPISTEGLETFFQITFSYVL